MEKVVITIFLMPREKPNGLEEYKRLPSVPKRLRTHYNDYLIRYQREIEVKSPNTYRTTFFNEIQRLNDAAKGTKYVFRFHLMKFGDMAVGYAEDEMEFFFVDIYRIIKTIK